MAWTKTKTVIIGGVIALLAIGTGTVAVSAINASRTAAALTTMRGNWEGTLSVGPARLRIVFKIFQTNGTYCAVMDSIDQNAQNIPVLKLSARGHSLYAELPQLDADYQAAMNADGTELSGKFTQLNKSYELTLKRTDEPDSIVELTADDFAPRQGSDLQGVWTGTLKTRKAALHLNLKIAETSPGTFQAQLDSVDQGAMNLPVTSLTYNPPAVQFKMDGLDVLFTGNLNDRDDELTGTWTQLGKKWPLTFDRAQTNAPAVTEAQKDYGQGTIYQVQGHWKGTLKVNGVALPVIFHIALMPDGSYSATMDSPEQGAFGIPASLAEVDFPNVHLEWKTMGGVYTGKLDDGKLSGTWSQGKVSLPLQLARETAP